MPPTGQTASSASDSFAAHRFRRMETANDGNSKEARSGDTMEGCSQCDVLPFSPPSQAHGHCAPEAVSRQKLEKLGLHGSLCPAATAVGCAVWELILAIVPDRRVAVRTKACRVWAI